MHCVFDWLGKTVVLLGVLVGILYASAYATGWPNLPDPDKQYRKRHGEQRQRFDCPSDTPMRAENHAM